LYGLFHFRRNTNSLLYTQSFNPTASCPHIEHTLLQQREVTRFLDGPFFRDKRYLLKENAKDNGWRRDGLNSAAFEVVGGVEKPLPSPPVSHPSPVRAHPGGDGDAPACLRGAHVTFLLLASITDALTCIECGVSKPPSGFSTGQHRKANPKPLTLHT